MRLARSALAAGLVSWGLGVVTASAQQGEVIAIALLPVVVHSAEAPEYLREGLADMLSSRLQQVEQFRVIRVDQSSLATTNLEQALKTGRKLEADFVLFGSFTRFGQGASLDMQCSATAQTASEPPLREIFVHSGSIGDVIPDLDELVGKVSRFAIPGFQEAPADAAGAAPRAGASRRVVEDLRKRVEALESTLGRFVAELESLKSKTSDE